MSEPVYEYVKGQGWLICTHPTCRLSCGTLVRFEIRMPEIGERYTYLHREWDPAWFVDGKANMDKFLNFNSIGRTYNGFLTRSTASSLPYRDPDYVWFVPVRV